MDTILQEYILDQWMSDTHTQEIITKTTLTPDQFKKLFASKILEYLLNVHDKKALLGDCPVIFAMVTIFQKSNLSVADVHHICDTFKITLVMALLKENKQELTHQLLLIARENFKGVLKSFLQIKYKVDIGPIDIVNSGDYLVEGSACPIESGAMIIDSHLTHVNEKNEAVNETLNEDKFHYEQQSESPSLNVSHNALEESDYVKNYVNTKETEEEFYIIHETLTGALLDDFNDTNELFLNSATLEETFTPLYHEILSNSIDMYISIFLDLVFFNKITVSLNSLKYLISDTSNYSEDQLLIMKQLTESIMMNLIKWKEEVIDNYNKAIHYYDDAIIGDIEQLKVMLTTDHSQESGADEAFEDLDDIFDF